jgi:hypothetical protein
MKSRIGIGGSYSSREEMKNVYKIVVGKPEGKRETT